MFPCIIPAQSGFYTVEKFQGQTVHLPVIGWYMKDEHAALAITLDGVVAEDTVVVGPDGKQAHR